MNGHIYAFCSLYLFLQIPLLEKGDIIIDGGNSEYRDTIVSFNLI